MPSLSRRWDEEDEGTGEPDNLNTEGKLEFGVSNPGQPAISVLEEPGSRIWLPYLEFADKYDRDLVQNWRDDMDSLLIFAALFSASVTAFVIESYKSLVQDTGDVTVSLLLQISKQLANDTHTPAAVRPRFRAQPGDVAVNVFWFLSLAFSLTCALAAVLVRQWARQYLRFPRSFSSTSERARARQYLFENMQWWRMDVIVDVIPALLHVSLLLFLIGILLFLHGINLTVAVYMLCFSIIAGVSYTLLTTAPVVFPGSPYRTPFSGLMDISLHLLKRLFRAAIIGVAVTLSILALSSLAFIRLWVPSFKGPEWKWATTQILPLQSGLKRHNISACSMFTVRRLPPTSTHFRSICHPLVTFIASLRKYNASLLGHLSKTLVSRRKQFLNELTTSDTDALSWVMQFFKQDSDSFAIVESIPDFVQSHQREVQILPVIWKSGVIRHVLRLLNASTRNSQHNGQMGDTNRVLMSCWETIFSMTRSSTSILFQLDESSFSISTHSWLKLFGALRPSAEVPHELRQVYACVASNAVVHLLYRLEKRPRRTRNFGFDLQFQDTFGLLRQFIIRFQNLLGCNEFKPDIYPTQLSADVLDVNLPPSPRHVLEELHDRFRTLRAEWATHAISELRPDPSASSRQRSFLITTLLDLMSHLHPYQQSTRRSQSAIFWLMDQSLVDTSFIELDPKGFPRLSQNVRLCYHRVLFKSARSMQLLGESSHRQRLNLHMDFGDRIRVYQGDKNVLPIISGDTVDIPHDQYVIILNDFWSSLHPVGGMVDNSAVGATVANVSHILLGDLQAQSIQKFIACRTRHVNDQVSVHPFVVDCDHLRVARALLNFPRKGRWKIAFWLGIIERTAKEFGYMFQLDRSFNLDIHAELQEYNID